jgi:hypothetical protein
MELDLARDLLLAAGRDSVSEEERRAVSMTYARYVELRARQMANEQRRNQGISFLEEDPGPQLRLPPHMAQEFMRARHRRPPAQFESRSEWYFQRLYRDLAR